MEDEGRGRIKTFETAIAIFGYVIAFADVQTMDGHWKEGRTEQWRENSEHASYVYRMHASWETRRTM
jgi:hypothetical protein